MQLGAQNVTLGAMGVCYTGACEPFRVWDVAIEWAYVDIACGVSCVSLSSQ